MDGVVEHDAGMAASLCALLTASLSAVVQCAAVQARFASYARPQKRSSSRDANECAHPTSAFDDNDIAYLCIVQQVSRSPLACSRAPSWRGREMQRSSTSWTSGSCKTGYQLPLDCSRSSGE